MLCQLIESLCETVIKLHESLCILTTLMPGHHPKMTPVNIFFSVLQF